MCGEAAEGGGRGRGRMGVEVGGGQECGSRGVTGGGGAAGLRDI